MLPRLASTWDTAVAGDATRTLAAASTIAMTIGTAGTANRTAGPGTIGMTETATITAGTTETAGTGVIVGALLRGRASRPSTEGVGATRGALRGVAARPALGTMMRPPRARCLLTATATLAGEATVR